MNATSLRWKTVDPTVFFVQTAQGLRHAVDLTIRNAADAVDGIVAVSFGSQEEHIDIGKIASGERTYRVYLPDIREPVPIELRLQIDGKVQDRYATTWMPQTHWHVYMIPIAHHDFGYTDSIENVLHLYDTFYDDTLRFCEETEDWPEESQFRYTAEQFWSMQHFIENRPKRVVDKLVKYIREGRIEVPALFGNEITTLCSHEELIRLMYPSFRARREYGIPIRTASITDIPGLSWGLPTVLAGAGVRYFFAGLPDYFEWGRNDIHTFWDESAILRQGRPDAFRWEGPDGETVLVYYQGGYGTWTSSSSYQDMVEELPRRLRVAEEGGCPFDVARYAYNGSDNRPPDVGLSHIAREWNSRWAYPKIVVGTNSMFFEHLERQCSDARVFRGELPDTDYVVGATSTAKQTAINRITHDRLRSAEEFATVASAVSDCPYPAETIRRAYDNLLLYDEHTWGVGQSVGVGGQVHDWCWSDKSHCAYRAAGLTESTLDSSLDRIAELISLKEEGRHIVVFNSLSFQRTDVVRVPRFAVEEPFDLVDEETGWKIAYQIVELDSPQAPVPYAPQRYARGQFNPAELVDLVFVAEDVPSLGYKTYHLAPKGGAAPSSNASGRETDHGTSSTAVGETGLENRFFRVTLNPQTGAIQSIYDKELRREIADEEAPHRLNQFIARRVQTGKEESPKRGKIRKTQGGPIYGSLVISGAGAGCPQLTCEIILYDHIRRIDLANRVLKDSTAVLEIYFAFPFLMEKPSFRFEGSNSVIEPLSDQFPGSNTNYYAVQHWADVGDKEMGITLSAIESHLLEFGGLWPCFVSQACHGVAPPDFGRAFVKADEVTKGYIYSYVMDTNFRTNFQPVQQDDMLFRYSITTHKGDWKEGRARDFGWAIANPLIPVCVNGNRKGVGPKGSLPRSASFCQVDQSNVLLLALKQAEDGNGMILRLIETEGRPVEATVTMPFFAIAEAHQTSLVEENQERLTCSKNTMKIRVKPLGITTIRVQRASC